MYMKICNFDIIVNDSVDLFKRCISRIGSRYWFCSLPCSSCYTSANWWKLQTNRFVSILISSSIIETLWIFGFKYFHPVVLLFKYFFPCLWTHFTIHVVVAFKYFKYLAKIWRTYTQSFWKCLIIYSRLEFAVPWISRRLCSGRTVSLMYWILQVLNVRQ